MRNFMISILLLLSTGCENHRSVVAEEESKITKPIPDSTSLLTKKEEEDEENMFLRETEIHCDSIYNKEYKVELSQFTDKRSYHDSVYNSTFRFSLKTGEDYNVLFTDSVQSHYCRIKFEDFNNDSVKDILVQNISDVRSNTTFYLYLVDKVNNQLNKIEGFQRIKNPNYLAEYDLIDNFVMSGTSWKCYYSIRGDSIHDYDICIDDEHKEDDSFSIKQQKAINKILRMN